MEIWVFWSFHLGVVWGPLSKLWWSNESRIFTWIWVNFWSSKCMHWAFGRWNPTTTRTWDCGYYKKQSFATMPSKTKFLKWVSLEMPHTYLNILFEIHFFEIISHSCLYLVHYPHSSRWHSFWRMHFYFSFTLFDLLLFLHFISCFFFVFWVCMKIFFENSMNEVDLGWSFHMLILCLSTGIKAI